MSVISYRGNIPTKFYQGSVDIITEQLAVRNSLNDFCYQWNCMNCIFSTQHWHLYVWELDIKWLSIAVVDVVKITNADVFHHFFY